MTTIRENLEKWEEVYLSPYAALSRNSLIFWMLARCWLAVSPCALQPASMTMAARESVCNFIHVYFI